jgi:putative redox protein
VTNVRHIARAVGSTGSTEPAHRVEVRAGAHQLVADEAVARGGGDLGPSPFGLVLSGLAACTAITLRMYAERKGWPLASIGVDVRYDAADDGTTAIERSITVPADLDPERRQRLADIAERTPVTTAIKAGTPITTTFQTRSTLP